MYNNGTYTPFRDDEEYFYTNSKSQVTTPYHCKSLWSISSSQKGENQEEKKSNQSATYQTNLTVEI